MANLVKLSKFISLMLRHKPDQFGLVLDSDGFASFDDVWQQIQLKYGNRYDYQDFETLLAKNEGGRQRFQVNDGRIRAMYGHSTVEISYPAVAPPEILYHGTITEAYESIRVEGIKSQQRQYVHLSTDKKRAENVATRYGKPVILSIRALDAHHDGHIFHHPEPKHFLVKYVPPEYISIDD